MDPQPPHPIDWRRVGVNIIAPFLIGAAVVAAAIGIVWRPRHVNVSKCAGVGRTDVGDALSRLHSGQVYDQLFLCAIDAGQRLVVLLPHSQALASYVKVCQGMLYLASGHPRQAAKALDEARDVASQGSSPDQVAIALGAEALVMAGRRDEARKRLAGLRYDVSDLYVQSFHGRALSALPGMASKGLAVCDEAFHRSLVDPSWGRGAILRNYIVACVRAGAWDRVRKLAQTRRSDGVSQHSDGERQEKRTLAKTREFSKWRDVFALPDVAIPWPDIQLPSGLRVKQRLEFFDPAVYGALADWSLHAVGEPDLAGDTPEALFCKADRLLWQKRYEEAEEAYAAAASHPNALSSLREICRLRAAVCDVCKSGAKTTLTEKDLDAVTDAASPEASVAALVLLADHASAAPPVLSRAKQIVQAAARRRPRDMGHSVFKRKNKTLYWGLAWIQYQAVRAGSAAKGAAAAQAAFEGVARVGDDLWDETRRSNPDYQDPAFGAGFDLFLAQLSRAYLCAGRYEEMLHFFYDERMFPAKYPPSVGIAETIKWVQLLSTVSFAKESLD